MDLKIALQFFVMYLVFGLSLGRNLKGNNLQFKFITPKISILQSYAMTLRYQYM